MMSEELNTNKEPKSVTNFIQEIQYSNRENSFSLQMIEHKYYPEIHSLNISFRIKRNGFLPSISIRTLPEAFDIMEISTEKQYTKPTQLTIHYLVKS